MFKYYLKLLSLPLFLLFLFVTLFILWKIFDLPPSEVLIGHVGDWFSQYGIWAMFFSAMIEGALLVGGYFPGGFIIFVGVALSESALQAAAMVVSGTIGLIIAHTFNYTLGRYGWYKLLVKFGLKSSIEREREKLITKGPIAIFSSYWMPSMSAITDTAAGIIQMPFKKFIFYSVTASIFWNSVVGLIVYNFGDEALTVATPGGNVDFVVQLGIVAIWMAVLLILDFRKKARTQ